MFWGPVVAAALGSVASAFGQRDANRRNIQLAREQMAFQERMSSTSFQRGMADMRAAGLNPMLAFGQGGASTPGGAMARTESVVPEDSAATAQAAVMQRHQMKLMHAQIQKARAEAHTAHSEQNIRRYSEEMARGRRNFYFDIHGRPRGPLAELLRSEHGQALANSAQSVNQAELSKLSIPEQEAISRLFQQFGEGGKGFQILLPLIMSMMRR